MNLCPHCGQPLPVGASYLTPRELEVLAAWWLEGTVRAAAKSVGVGEQRAKNLLAQARNRNRAASTQALLAMHFVAVGSVVRAGSVTKHGNEEAA